MHAPLSLSPHNFHSFSSTNKTSPDPSHAGTFKQQHDTGQNLKYVVVYPNVSCASGGNDKAAEGGVAVNTKSPEYVMCSSDLEGFKKKVNQKVRRS